MLAKYSLTILLLQPSKLFCFIHLCKKEEKTFKRTGYTFLFL